MAVEEALWSVVTGDDAVKALIGARLFPLVIPEDATLPAAAYQRISGPRMLAHDGPTGLAMGRFQFTATATTYAAAKGVIGAIRECLDGYQGTVDGEEIEVAAVEGEYDGYGQIATYATVRLDTFVVYKE